MKVAYGSGTDLRRHRQEGPLLRAKRTKSVENRPLALERRLLDKSGRSGLPHGMSENSHKRKLALPKEAEHWSLTTLREKLIKIGAKVMRHGRYITFQLAEVAIPRSLFANILRLIDGLIPAPLPQ